MVKKAQAKAAASAKRKPAALARGLASSKPATKPAAKKPAVKPAAGPAAKKKNTKTLEQLIVDLLDAEGKLSLAVLKARLLEERGVDYTKGAAKSNLKKALEQGVSAGQFEKRGGSYTTKDFEEVKHGDSAPLGFCPEPCGHAYCEREFQLEMGIWWSSITMEVCGHHMHSKDTRYKSDVLCCKCNGNNSSKGNDQESAANQQPVVQQPFGGGAADADSLASQAATLPA